MHCRIIFALLILCLHIRVAAPGEGAGLEPASELLTYFKKESQIPIPDHQFQAAQNAFQMLSAEMSPSRARQMVGLLIEHKDLSIYFPGGIQSYLNTFVSVFLQHDSTLVSDESDKATLFTFQNAKSLHKQYRTDAAADFTWWPVATSVAFSCTEDKEVMANFFNWTLPFLRPEMEDAQKTNIFSMVIDFIQKSGGHSDLHQTHLGAACRAQSGWKWNTIETRLKSMLNKKDDE